MIAYLIKPLKSTQLRPRFIQPIINKHSIVDKIRNINEQVPISISLLC